LSIPPSYLNWEFSLLFEDDIRSGYKQVAINKYRSNTISNIEFDDQPLETPNLAKSTNSDTLKRKLRKALKLEDYGTPKVDSSVRVPNI